MIKRISEAAFLVASVALGSCADAPHGPYRFCDYSDTTRVGGDYIEMITYKPGPKDAHLQAPKLLYPLDRMVFSHFPRELVYRWQPAKATPPDADYLFESDFVSGNDEKFGDWSKQPDPTIAYRTRKTTLNDRFVGAQPGRWRVKVITKAGESEWSEWCYFRFTR